MSEAKAIDVWLRIPEGEVDSEAEANTFHDGDRFRVDWYLTSVGLVKSRWFDSYEQAAQWLTSEGFGDYSSGGDEFAPLAVKLDPELEGEA